MASDNAPLLEFKLVTPTAQLPTRGSAGAAGLDLYASEPALIKACTHAAISTGIAVQIPEGCYGKVEARSGLAFKHSIQTGAGVIDSDYRGEIKVLLFNHGDYDFEVTQGMRVAQLIVQPYVHLTPVALDSSIAFGTTPRGARGFGSTGLY